MYIYRMAKEQHAILAGPVIDFISQHPLKALLILHHLKQRKGSGKKISFKSVWNKVKSVGKKAGEAVYKGAETFYDHTNGLPIKAVETIAKKVLNTDLNDYATYRDAKKAYSYATGDPRKFKEIYNAVSTPKKTLSKMKKHVVPAIAGFVIGGPAGAATAVVKAEAARDVVGDIEKITGEGKGVPAKLLEFIRREPAMSKKVLDEALKKGEGKKTKKALKVTAGITGTAAFLLYGFIKDNPQLVPSIRNAIKVHMGKGVLLPGQKKGAGIPAKHEKFIKKHPKIAKKIMAHIKKHPLQSGKGIMSKVKNVLAVVGATSLVGAYAFTKWYGQLQGADPHTADSKTAFYINQVLNAAKGAATRKMTGEGSFAKKNPEIAKKIRKVMKESQEGGRKKKKKTSDSKIKKLLISAGIVAIPAAVAYAKKYFDDTGYDSEEEFGAISAEQYKEMFGEGKKKPVPIMVPSSKKRKGTKREVWKGVARMTGGGLKKDDLLKNGRGKIVSKRQQALGKRNYEHIRKYSFKKK